MGTKDSFDDNDHKAFVLGVIGRLFESMKRYAGYTVEPSSGVYDRFDGYAFNSDGLVVAVIEIKDRRSDYYKDNHYSTMLLECHKIEKWLDVMEDIPNLLYVVEDNSGIWLLPVKKLGLDKSADYEGLVDRIPGLEYNPNFNRYKKRPGGEVLRSDANKRVLMVPDSCFYKIYERGK